MREGKGCIVMHVKSAVYTLLSQLSILFYISLSFPLSLFFHFQPTILILLVTMFSLLPCVLPHIRGYCSFYTKDQAQVISLFCPCFPPTILSTIGIQPTPITYCSGHVKVGSLHYLLAASSGFSPTTCLATNIFPFLGKSQSSHNTTISFFLLTANHH